MSLLASHKEELPQSVEVHMQQLERMRRDFIANVSHELRTPLTVIRGYLEALLEQAEASNAQQVRIFQQMYQQSLRMEHLTEDLLLLSHLESSEQGDCFFEPVDVGEMLKTICHDVQQLDRTKQHKITLQLEPGLILQGNSHELKSIFSNLIINAIKYTPGEGSIHVVWRAEQGRAVFSVTDTGIGIAADDIPRLTERFYRVDKARSRASGGTGLGLAIVKHALLRHKAHLEIDSKLGAGSCFRCVFPIKS